MFTCKLLYILICTCLRACTLAFHWSSATGVRLATFIFPFLCIDIEISNLSRLFSVRFFFFSWNQRQMLATEIHPNLSSAAGQKGETLWAVLRASTCLCVKHQLYLRLPSECGSCCLFCCPLLLSSATLEPALRTADPWANPAGGGHLILSACFRVTWTDS